MTAHGKREEYRSLAGAILKAIREGEDSPVDALAKILADRDAALRSPPPAGPSVGEETQQVFDALIAWYDRAWEDDGDEYMNKDGWNDIGELVKRARAVLAALPHPHEGGG